MLASSLGKRVHSRWLLSFSWMPNNILQVNQPEMGTYPGFRLQYFTALASVLHLLVFCVVLFMLVGGCNKVKYIATQVPQ